GGGTAMAMAVGGGAPVDSAALQAFEARQERLIRDFLKSYAEFLGDDPRSGEKKAEMEAELRRKAEEELALWVKEHGEFYANGIKPLFDSRKLREYESYWNLARQDTLELYHGLASEALKYDGPEATSKANRIINNATRDVSTVIEFHERKAEAEGRKVLAAYFRTLGKVVRDHLDQSPVYFDNHVHMAPQLEIKPDGEIVYKEVPRPGINSASDYVAEMRIGSDYPVEQVPDGLPR